jgi:lysine biosynthesis protein LysW
MTKKSNLSDAYCLSCDGSIVLRRAVVGQLVICPHCRVQLEIVSEDPLEFYWLWEEDDDETEID